MTVTSLRRKPKLRLVEPEPTERVFGSPGFIALDRKSELPPAVWPIARTAKRSGDIII